MPVEALDDEDVLQDELQQAEQRVGKVEARQGALGAHRQGRHQREVGERQLAQRRRHQEHHVQAARGIVAAIAGPPLQPVEQHPRQATQGHGGHDGQVVAVEEHEGGEAQIRLAHHHLVEDEDDQADGQDQAAQQQAHPGLHDHPQGQLVVLVLVVLVVGVVVPGAHPPAHVLPHDIDHAARHQVELHVEGVEDLHALPEGQAEDAGTALALAAVGHLCWQIAEGGL